MINTLKNLVRRLIFFIYYLRRPPWDTGISPPELMEFIEEYPAGRAIDLGCGTGTNIITLAQHGWQVSGVDFIHKAVQTAKRKIQTAGVKAKVFEGDVTRLEFPDNSFDLALDIGCYHNLDFEGKQTYEKTLSKILSPGGYFLLYGFTRTPERTFGIDQSDVARLQDFLVMEYRQEGTNRGSPSAWYKFSRPARDED